VADLVETKSLWRGPYRLRVAPWEISFDIPMEEISAWLGISRPKTVNRKTLLEFTKRYAKAISLYAEGRLAAEPRARMRKEEDALSKLSELNRDPKLDVRLRLLANLAIVRTFDRLGRFKAAATTLDQSARAAKNVRDPVVAAGFHLANAWRHYRAGNQKEFARNLLQVQRLSTETTDSNLLATNESAQGLHLSNTHQYPEALLHLTHSLDARLPTENFDAIQATCFNIGNTLQRMGEKHYVEAARWLELSVDICSWMRLGRYDAMAEVILAKIALETGDTKGYRVWISSAEQLASHSHNRPNQLWCHVVRAFYHQRYQEPKGAIDHLVAARKMYLATPDYDRATIEKYLERKFPEFWEQIIR
jgi:tetratricopeptide (TPR) repeat protein